jgi:hypothetical protein
MHLEKGFYRHYKHDPAGTPLNYTYEVIGVGRNTEDDTLTVIYRPLYKSDWMQAAEYQLRPLEMFMENVLRDGVSVPRFTLLTDAQNILTCREKRDEMYGLRTLSKE